MASLIGPASHGHKSGRFEFRNPLNLPLKTRCTTESIWNESDRHQRFLNWTQVAYWARLKSLTSKLKPTWKAKSERTLAKRWNSLKAAMELSAPPEALRFIRRINSNSKLIRLNLRKWKRSKSWDLIAIALITRLCTQSVQQMRRSVGQVVEMERYQRFGIWPDHE